MRLIQIAVFTVLVCGCVGSKGSPEGSEAGACYGNNTCDDGLSCYSKLCVKAPSTLSPQGLQEELARAQEELQQLRIKLEAAQMTAARLQHLREADEFAAVRAATGKAEPKVRNTNDKISDWPTVKSPFDDDNKKKPKVRRDPCAENPNRPECMLD